MLQHFFDRVDGAMACCSGGQGSGAAGAARGGACPQLRADARDAAETALEVLRAPMDYYLQYALDSAMTTLEQAWKPALDQRTPFAAENPAGLAFILARLDPAGLAALPRSKPVYDALLTRPGIERAPAGSHRGLGASEQDRQPRGS